MAKLNDSWRSGGTGRGAYTLVARTAGEVPLTLRGATGQTANLFLIENSAGTDLFAVSAAGNVTLTGDLTVTGTITAQIDEAVTGNSTITGNLTVNGNTILGNAAGDTLTVNAASTFAGVLTVNATARFNVPTSATAHYLRRQTPAPSANNDNGAIYTSTGDAGTTELFYLDAAGNSVQITDAGALEGASLFWDDDEYIRMGNTAAAPDVRMGWNTAQTVDAWYFGTADAQNVLLIAENGDRAFDFAHGAQTNPTVYIHSAVQNVNQWLSFTHNQTDAAINVGIGALQLMTQTITPGAAFAAVVMNTTFGAENFNHSGLQVTAVQSGANTQIVRGILVGKSQSGVGTLATYQSIHLAGPTIGGTITVNTGLNIADQAHASATTSYGINIESQTATNTVRAINLAGTGLPNAIRLGGSANMYSNGAENIRFMDSTDASGLAFNLTAAGNQQITPIAGDMVFAQSGVGQRAFQITNNTTARTSALVLATFDGTAGAAAGGTLFDINVTQTGAGAAPLFDIVVSALYTGDIHFVSIGAVAYTGDILDLDLGATSIAGQIAVLTGGAAARTTHLVELNDAGTSTGVGFDINKTGGSYSAGLGYVDLVRSGSFTGTATDQTADFRIAPAFTLTEPGAGTFSYYGAWIDMSGILVTAGVGAARIACLTLTGNDDVDLGTSRAILITGTGATNAIEFGDSTLVYSPSADVLRIDEASGANGLVITLSAGNQIITSTSAGLEFGISSISEITLTATAFGPTANDGNALGVSGTAWSDLFLASGAIINFFAGDVTITHGANTLAFAGVTAAGGGYTFDELTVINKATTGIALDINISATAYTTATGAIDVVRSGALTGVATETLSDLRIAPAFALTEPAAGTFTFSGASIDVSGMTVGADTGTTVVSALRLTGSAAAFGTSRALILGGSDAANSIQFGTATTAPIVYSSGAEVIRHMDSTNVNGVDFVLAATASQAVRTVSTTTGSLLLQGQTFTSGATHFAVLVQPSWTTTDNFEHHGFRVSVSQAAVNSATRSLVGISSIINGTGVGTTAQTNAMLIETPLVANTVTLNIGFDIATQTNGGGGTITTSRAMRTQTGVNNAWVVGASALMFANAAENIRFADSTNARGIDFNLTAGGNQNIETSAGNLDLSAGSEIVRAMDSTLARGISFTLTAAGAQTMASTAGDLILNTAAGGAELIQLSTDTTQTSTLVRILNTSSTISGNSLLVEGIDSATNTIPSIPLSLRLNRIAVAPTGDLSFVQLQASGTVGTAGASTVTNLTGFQVNDITYGAGLVVTRASMFRFTAAMGTHKFLPASVDASTANVDDGALTIFKFTENATVRSAKIIAYIATDINGTLGYIPVFDVNP